MPRKALIVGAGSYGEVMLTYLQEANYNIVGFIDDDLKKIGTKVQDIPVLGSFNDFVKRKFFIDFEVAFCSIGNNKIRVNYLSGLQMLGYETPSFIHNSVEITKNTIIGKGCCIFPNCTIMPYTNIEDYTMISVGTSISHHTIIKQGTLLSLGVVIGAYVTIGEQTVVGVGASVKSGPLKIGNNALIGAGAVVVKNVPANSVIVGNPGRILKKQENTKKLEKETPLVI